MSLFDILNSPELKSTLGSFAGKARNAASDLSAQAPGGLGGLLGAGALGALLGGLEFLSEVEPEPDAVRGRADRFPGNARRWNGILHDLSCRAG